ncbi:efflux RND transporter periplasmic adaptor subunit [Rhodoblastus acidophilus]|uniref:Efflux RND transporter periplasmic adaptor subunit n=1 Tax=Rhodoblastus acidophilus TaxID=1074 RepID=A0A6N8DN94_RHOAC|nr:efflux RND transporter periplasmic adaptor subunit [Rhodoblastus acidophilus]MCW2274100.1 RND family efflux transporter MFP subunit [Rhodoblastus acidophilus]MTV30673.1 efflux RND transporter periplasmic adaptor subunit [Rhodoblastus acidophilus]
MNFFQTAALIGLSLLAACTKPEAQKAEPPRPAMTMIATPASAFDTAFSGVVQPQTQSALSFRVLGRIISRPVKAGDRVEAGQIIAALDPTAYEAAARAAAATLASARAQFDNAASTEARQSALLAKKTASQAAFDTAEQARASAQAAMQQAEASLVKAKEQLTYTVLKAEYSGIVTATSAEIGQTVAPGQAVVTVAEPTRRDAVIDAPEAVIDAFSLGDKFKVALQIDPAVSAAGTLREIAPESDAATRSRRLKIALESPPPAFRLGSTISARVASDGNPLIRLPASALLQEGDRTRVFIVDPETMKVSAQDIEVAPERDGRFLVRGGLKGGERVVVAGVHRLKEGQQVRLFGSVQP